MLSDAVLQFLAHTAYPIITSWGLSVARALGIILISPAFSRLGLTGLLRGAVAAILALPVAPVVFDSLQHHPDIGNVAITGLMLKEMMIGLVLGVLFGIPLWAAEMAGELIDLQRGATSAQLFDPLYQVEHGVTGTLMSLLVVVLFFVSGAFMTLIGGLYQSYTLWPVFEYSPALDSISASQLLGILDQIMRSAVIMVAPLTIAILLADIMLAFLARMSPNLHVFDLSLSVKNLLFSFFILIYFIFLIPQLEDSVADLGNVMPSLSAAADHHGGG
ncbi:Surface presentation of antigens protein SpaR [Carnimonas sp. R-84981]|uniref:type III secretion system export apparatus subunit SctT n=1 Tax=Carnimonas bestiolae TaxID=3402172 RepID=UPI003EDBA6C6